MLNYEMSKILFDILKKYDIITKDYTGKYIVTFNINQGGLTSVQEITEITLRGVKMT